MMNQLVKLSLAVLVPSLGHAVPCQPLPSPKITVSATNVSACRLAVQNGGTCSIVATVANKGVGNTTTIALGRQLVGDFPGTIPGSPPATGPRKPTSTLLGTGQVFSVGANATVNLSQAVTLAAGAKYTCFKTLLNSENPLCGSTSDVRRQYPVGLASLCILSPAYPASSYPDRLSCGTALWDSSGGTCTKGPDCWLHDQVFTRILTVEEETNWITKNCGLDNVNIYTVPLLSNADGPYGYDL